jgi:hypothetical protein
MRATPILSSLRETPTGTSIRDQRRRGRRGRVRSDVGQTAIVMVIAISVLLMTLGAVMVTTISNNDPILTQTSIQRYAYRALASGLNAYTNAINADPFLAACNTATNQGGSNPSNQCAGISYGTWSAVPDTTGGNGIVPEYYKFDNPQQVINSSTNALQELEVQIVGAAGFPGKNVFYSTIAHFVPANGFLNNVWWTNFESTGTPSQCTYYWNGYTPPNNCTEVDFVPQDSITGPIFSNDSIYVAGGPNFGNYGVTTADPNCLFVAPGVNQGGNNLGQPPSPQGANNNCAQTGADEGVTYNAAQSSFGAKNFEPIPTDNSQLGNYAKQNGCYYTGPTTIILNSNGTMTVTSKGTSTYPNVTSGSSLKFGGNTSTCPTNGTASLPTNGVVFVDQGGSNASGVNPFDGNGQTCNGQNPCTQTQPGGCGGCYFGQTGSPDNEGDAFVAGSLSGQLTIGANNDVIIQGPISYADCTQWVGTPHQSACKYNNAVTGTNDTLGLIAYNYVEISRPQDGNNNILKYCGQNGALAAPLCNPATPNGGGLTLDASLLGLQQSFIVNNYNIGNVEGQLTVYGSIQQNSRGPVGTHNGNNLASGYGKTYTWDPRLALYAPPFYLTPGTPSWALTSSAESYCGAEPAVPPVQQTPQTTQPPWPTSCGAIPNGWTAGSPAS